MLLPLLEGWNRNERTAALHGTGSMPQKSHGLGPRFNSVSLEHGIAWGWRRNDGRPGPQVFRSFPVFSQKFKLQNTMAKPKPHTAKVVRWFLVKQNLEIDLWCLPLYHGLPIYFIPQIKRNQDPRSERRPSIFRFDKMASASSSLTRSLAIITWQHDGG